ncbi:MAG: arylsulfatase [Novosphingobium sp.]
MVRTVSAVALAIAALGAQPSRAEAPAASSSPSRSVPAPTAPARPNVLVWMMDDVGFAQVGAFGGLVETPNIDRVARMGLRYDNYHTAPICSASRAAFLTGRMPHSVHIGGHSTAARDFPGYDAKIPASAGTIAANLHAAGYATYALGKWDHLPNGDASPAGPFRYWATGQGFDRFYGFLAADADNWNPILIRDVTPVQKPDAPDFHLSADLADKAIAMIEERDARTPQRPFFMYWATGAAHAPHHAPADWIARYKGRFDMGWDKAREAILKRQVAQGLVPKNTRLAPRPEGLPDWQSLSPDQKRLYARQMEVFAASLAYADAQFGRLLDSLAAKGELDNTMVIITSDNGASAEGGMDGLHNEAAVTGSPPGVAGNLRFYADWGGPKTYPHYSNGWAVAGNTPYRYFKQTAHEGGSRVPLIISWPKGIAARGEQRSQFVHVSDIAPTILDAASVPLAEVVNDVKQQPMEGASIVASFAAQGSPRDGRAQYVELYGNKGLWEGGWQIVTTHRYRTWEWKTAPTFDEPWELYDVVRDPGQTTDLAAKFPERVSAMAAKFDEQAKRYNVAPIHNLSDTMAESIKRGRKAFADRGGKWRYSGIAGNIPNELVPPMTSMGFSIGADLDLPASGITGPIFAFGGQVGGMALYLDKGRPTLLVNSLAGDLIRADAAETIGPGKTRVEMVLHRGATASDGASDYHVVFKSGGRPIGEATMHVAIPVYFGISEVFGVGIDDGSPVLAGARAGTPIPGGISNVLFDFGSSQPAPHTSH